MTFKLISFKVAGFLSLSETCHHFKSHAIERAESSEIIGNSNRSTTVLTFPYHMQEISSKYLGAKVLTKADPEVRCFSKLKTVRYFHCFSKIYSVKYCKSLLFYIYYGSPNLHI